MANFPKARILTLILAVMLCIPTILWGQFEVLDIGYAFESPGFLSSTGVMAYDGNQHRLAISDDAREAVLIFNLNDMSYQTMDRAFGLSNPTGLDFDPGGALYISYEDSRKIIKVAPELNSYDSLFLGGDLYNNFSPGRLTVCENGELFVLDTENGSVCGFDSSGKFIMKIAEKLRRPDGIYVNQADDIFVADKGVNPILQFSPNGKYIRNLSRPEDPTAQSSFSASGLAVDQRGWFYTIDATHNKIVRIDPTGVNRLEWSPEPPFFPRDIVIDKFDNIYIWDGGAGRILMLESH